jgi:CRP-like cAMP-binding protein
VQDVRRMFDQLHKHLLEKTPMSKEEFSRGSSFLIPKRVRKNSYLLEAGEVCVHLAFVTKGCLRSYTIDKKGEEHIMQFAPERWWITDLYSYLTGKESTFFIDALEESDVLLLEASSFEKLFTAAPEFERYFRILLQNNYIATHRRILGSISLSAEERYLQLLADYPTLSQRVTQRHIASYLGITPEALSRIRRRMAEQPRS